MKIKSINGQGYKGINTDLAPWELPSEFITAGRNFKIDGNRIISAGPHKVLATPSNDPQAGHLVPVHGPTGDFILILGHGSGDWKAQCWDGSSFTDISSATGAYNSITTPEDWTSCMLGKVPIVNHYQHYPEYWDPQTAITALTPLKFDPSNTWSAVSKQFKVIRAHQNYLFALYLIESGVTYPNAYRWSHPAPINNLPASWDETDDAYIAGRSQVGGDTGSIIDGLTLRDAFCIYSEFGITILDKSGDEFIWSPRVLSETYGVLNDKCIQEVKGVHFFLTDGDILKNDGNSINSIVENILLKRLRSNINPENFGRSYTVRDTVNKELWFCVPEGSAEYPDTAYVYNWYEGKWSIQDVPYSEDGSGNVTGDTIHACFGVRPVEPILWSDFDVASGKEWAGLTWADSGLTWSGNTVSPLNRKVIGVDAASGGDLTELDPTTASSEDTEMEIERTDIYLEGPQQVCTVVRLYPYMDGIDPVMVQIGSQMFAGGDVHWESPVTFDPTTDKKIDVRSTGALHAYRIASIGTGEVKMTGMAVEYELDGSR